MFTIPALAYQKYQLYFNSPTSAIDVVAVFNTESGEQVLNGAKIMEAAINREKKVMKHPRETGSTIIDFTITLPIEITLTIILEANVFKNIYSEIVQLSESNTLLSIQTKAAFFSNFLIQGNPHTESAELFDALAVVVKLEESQFFSAQYDTIKPQDPTQGSTVDRGYVAPTPANDQQTENSSYLYKKFFT